MNMISAIAAATGTPDDDHAGGLGLTREQWAEQSIIDGTDWQTLTQAALNVLVAAGIVELEPSTFEIACERADRERSRRRAP
jgi:hypothetical protein